MELIGRLYYSHSFSEPYIPRIRFFKSALYCTGLLTVSKISDTRSDTLVATAIYRLMSFFSKRVCWFLYTNNVLWSGYVLNSLIFLLTDNQSIHLEVSFVYFSPCINPVALFQVRYPFSVVSRHQYNKQKNQDIRSREKDFRVSNLC